MRRVVFRVFIADVDEAGVVSVPEEEKLHVLITADEESGRPCCNSE